jgi:hypothetical protein
MGASYIFAFQIPTHFTWRESLVNFTRVSIVMLLFSCVTSVSLLRLLFGLLSRSICLFTLLSDNCRRVSKETPYMSQYYSCEHNMHKNKLNKIKKKHADSNPTCVLYVYINILLYSLSYYWMWVMSGRIGCTFSLCSNTWAVDSEQSLTLIDVFSQN